MLYFLALAVKVDYIWIHDSHLSAPNDGSGTTGGSFVHLHGAPSVPSTIAQPNSAPHCEQVLMQR